MRGNRGVLVATIAALSLLVAPTLAGATVQTGGTITVGQGINGVTLGMTRAQVIATLGTPVATTKYGYLGYGPKNFANLFDVYMSHTGTPKRVYTMDVSGKGFKLADGIAIFAKGGLRQLAAKYGKRLVFHQGDGNDGPFFEIDSRFHGKAVATTFATGGSSLNGTVAQVFISYAG
jgi:hypothetical protein